MRKGFHIEKGRRKTYPQVCEQVVDKMLIHDNS